MILFSSPSLFFSIKRDIGHLCHDEYPTKSNNNNDISRRSASGSTQATAVKAKSPAVEPISSSITPAVIASSSAVPSALVSKERGELATLAPRSKASPSPMLSLNLDASSQNQLNNLTWGNSALGGAGFLGLGGAGFLGGNGDATASGDAAGGNEFNILSEFLESLDGNSLTTPGANNGSTFPNGGTNFESDLASSFSQPVDAAGHSHTSGEGTELNPSSALVGSASGSGAANWPLPTLTTSASLSTSTSTRVSRRPSFSEIALTAGSSSSGLGGVSSKTERFFLTAADQKDGTRDERLGRVIQAKYDAGLLRPYNHVNGYARLNKWMEQNASQASRRRILKPLSIFRPAFRAVAQSLTNVDLIYIEEAFERLLLDYDRVFSTQGIPACLWRRTGEIYKGNKEFAELVGVGIEALREGRCTIYEFMQEESAVNYWEKYGAVSFDPGQKAVLTSCVLKTKGAGNHDKKQIYDETSKNRQQEDKKDAFVSCCFSFTIRRDAWSIPCLIVGNFLPLA